MTETSEGEPAVLNVVALRGRVLRDPVERELPSGDLIVKVRLGVGRDPTARHRSTKQTSDWVDCIAWTSRLRRTTGCWAPGDQVLVEGALRRRFYRAGPTTATSLEVELVRARRLVRAPA